MPARADWPQPTCEMAYHVNVTTLLATTSVFGAVVVLAFLIRNLIKRPAAIAAAQYPSYMRLTYNASHAMCLCCIVPWGSAALSTANLHIWLALMISPFPLALSLGLCMGRLVERQSPEVKAYAMELAKNSRVKRMIENQRRQE